MSGVNRVILVGYVGKDPEIRHTEGNIPFVRLSLATSEAYKTKDGQRKEVTEWHNVILWRGLAEIADKYVRKGKMLYIEGRIRTRTVEENNVKKYYTDIVADTMTMLGGPRVDSSSNGNGTEAALTGVTHVNEGGPTDDLPF